MSISRMVRGTLTGATSKGIDEVSDTETAQDSNNSGEGDGSTRLTERDSTNENDGFYTLTEHRNEWQNNQCPFSSLGTTVHGYRPNALKPYRHTNMKNQPFPSKASCSFTLHLAFVLSILSIVMPMTKMSIEAMSEKIPSHNSSDFFQRSEAWVNQTAMNAAPIASAMKKPAAEPMKIYRTKNEVGGNQEV